MILELLMHANDWTDCWYAHPGHMTTSVGRKVVRSIYRDHGWLRTALLYLRNRRHRWHVGVWTGPHKDLLCVKYCDTVEEAETWLSPGGSTATVAAVKAWLKSMRPTGAT